MERTKSYCRGTLARLAPQPVRKQNRTISGTSTSDGGGGGGGDKKRDDGGGRDGSVSGEDNDRALLQKYREGLTVRTRNKQ